MEMTFTEVREQILDNAMRLFLTVVEEYLNKYDVATAAPAEIFSIATMKAPSDAIEVLDEHGNVVTYKADVEKMQAFVIYDGLDKRRTALMARPRSSRYKALHGLLDATERALAIVDDPEVVHDRKAVRRAVRKAGFVVDVELLVPNTLRLGHR